LRYFLIFSVSFSDTFAGFAAMTTSATLLQSIRTTLRARNMTYRQLATALGVSEPTVKRYLSRGDFTLNRLDAICAALDLSLADLVQAPSTALLTTLSQEQERALVRDPRLLLITYLLVNGWTWAEITSTFSLDDNSLTSAVLRLDELNIVHYRPPRRIRKLTARNFAWRKDGPVHEFFVTRVAPEFLRARFDAPAEELRFIGGVLSAASQAQVKAAIERFAREFEDLAHRDARLPLEAKDGCSALLAFRQWEFSEFTRQRRRS
jgi:transcriptional regulator with XRE-family HTH domain